MSNIASIPVQLSTAAIAVGALAIFLLTGMDAVMKGLVLSIGLYNTMLWRSFAVVSAAGLAWSTGPRKWPGPIALKLHLLRGAINALVALLFFWGLSLLPVAEAIALSFIAPLIALYLASLILHERIGAGAIWGSALGLAGVVVIMFGKIGTTAHDDMALYGAGAILVSTLFYGLNLVLARKQAQISGPRETGFFQNSALLGLLLLAAPWLAQAVEPQHWKYILLAAALNLSGQMLLTWAYARAEAQYLIPLEYTAFVWAAALGWWFFGETLNLPTVFGAFLIISGCMLAAFKRLRRVAPIEPSQI